MDITGKIHCFFEQSGTFKNEFGETDNVIDLFAEIEKCYTGGAAFLIR